MFNASQKAMLDCDLDRKNVRTRKQAGRTVAYIEGWMAIAEANRIFGFDGWTSETVELRPVAETQRTIGESKAPGWGVSYIAKVRITVDMVVREGVGTGHGIDRDLGQAHESAIKEAETDARKRALMTFGNPFGLALYDKEQRHVSDVSAQQEADDAKEAKAQYIAACIAIINNFGTVKELGDWINAPAQRQARRDFGLSTDEVQKIIDAASARKADLAPSENMAAG